MFVWKVTFDRDWGTRGERRLYSVLFANKPSNETIENAFLSKYGLYLPRQWQQSHYSGMISIKQEEVLP